MLDADCDVREGYGNFGHDAECSETADTQLTMQSALWKRSNKLLGSIVLMGTHPYFERRAADADTTCMSRSKLLKSYAKIVFRILPHRFVAFGWIGVILN